MSFGYLENLVREVEKGEHASTHLTLWLPGGFVTGWVCSSGEAKSILAGKSFQQGEKPGDHDQLCSRPGVIFLKNVIFHAGGLVELPVWVGRIDAIAGFSPPVAQKTSEVPAPNGEDA